MLQTKFRLTMLKRVREPAAKLPFEPNSAFVFNKTKNRTPDSKPENRWTTQTTLVPPFTGSEDDRCTIVQSLS